MVAQTLLSHQILEARSSRFIYLWYHNLECVIHFCINKICQKILKTLQYCDGSLVLDQYIRSLFHVWGVSIFDLVLTNGSFLEVGIIDQSSIMTRSQVTG